jgi:hypothetical protein
MAALKASRLVLTEDTDYIVRDGEAIELTPAGVGRLVEGARCGSGRSDRNRRSRGTDLSSAPEAMSASRPTRDSRYVRRHHNMEHIDKCQGINDCRSFSATRLM